MELKLATGILAVVAVAFAVTAAQAQMPTLTMESAQPGGGTDVAAKNLAEVAARGKIATSKWGGKTLTKSILQVAQGKNGYFSHAFYS